MINQTYKINLIPNAVPVVIPISQYDKEARTIQLTILNGDEVFSIPNDCTITVLGTKPDMTGFQYPCTYSGSVVSFDIKEQMSVLAGKVNAEIRIQKDGGILGTANFILFVEKAGLSDDTVISDTDLPMIEQAVEIAEDLPIIENVNNNMQDINDVADALTNINNVANDLTNLDNIASDLTNINNVANDLTNLDNIASDLTNINNVANDLSNIDDVASNLSDINDIADNLEEILEADDSALKSEGYALGTQNGVEVGSDSPYYHNNSKYYAQVADSYTRKIYGIKRSLSSASSQWERTDDAVGMVANATHDGSDVINDFDNVYPYNSIISVNMADDGTINAQYGDVNFKFDGTNGEVMTYIPPFYYKRWQDGTYEYMQISNKLFDGASHVDGFYLGRYTTSSGAHSKSGVTSQVSTNITTFRTQARAKGTGWGQLDWHYFVLEMLYLVEYADYNSQSVLGQGVCSVSAQVSSGQLDNLGMKSGCLANAGATSVMYRGIENPFGNIWQFVDGINVQNNVAYINYDQDTYAVDTFTGDYSAVGYTNATSNGYSKTLGYDSDNSLVGLPTSVGGSSSQYMTDYYYQNSGNRIVIVGGAWNVGAYAGFFYWNCGNASSIAYDIVGSRLLKK